MPHSFAQVGGSVGTPTPPLNTDRLTRGDFHLAQAPTSGSTTQRAVGVGPISSFDTRGRPRLVTGQQAAEAASAIAADAWQPSNPDNRTTGRFGEGLLPYVSLADRLEPNARDRLDVVGAYGEIVFAADPSMSRAAQERYVEQAVAETRRAPTGRRILDSLAGESGLPIIVLLNDQQANGAAFPEDATVSTPAGAGEPAVRVKSNYDLIYWDPTSSPVSVVGHAAPPVTVLLHELQHAGQFASERERLPLSTDFPDGLIQQPEAFDRDVDANQNGIKDREDEATAVENVYLRELGLEPLRERYNSGIVGFVEVTGADARPTEEQIRTFLRNWQLRNQPPGV